MPASVKLGKSRELIAQVKRLLAAPNLCSKRWIHEQYESMVRTNTFQGPGGDAGVIRVKGTSRGLAMALDGNGRWCYLDPKLGAEHAVAEAARNVACAGATPVAATNCLNFGNPEKPAIMWQFSQVVDGIARAAGSALPSGGNVSFWRDLARASTPVVGGFRRHRPADEAALAPRARPHPAARLSRRLHRRPPSSVSEYAQHWARSGLPCTVGGKRRSEVPAGRLAPVWSNRARPSEASPPSAWRNRAC
jgi:hypothetical protein